MEIIFKDGKKIEFKKYGNIWLANNVIWERTELHISLDKLRELKAKIDQWFEENAPEEIREKYNARLPLQGEISALPFKYKIAYREGKTDEKADYFLGDEDHGLPVICLVDDFDVDFAWCRDAGYGWSDASAVRLCLEEKAR